MTRDYMAELRDIREPEVTQEPLPWPFGDESWRSPVGRSVLFEAFGLLVILIALLVGLIALWARQGQP